MKSKKYGIKRPHPLSPQKRAGRIRQYNRYASQWDLTVLYKGYDQRVDHAISKLLGKYPDSSGFFMLTDKRDLIFTYKTRNEAAEARKIVLHYMKVDTKLSNSKEFWEGMIRKLQDKTKFFPQPRPRRPRKARKTKI